MNGAISESTFNFFFKLNYDKTFTSILATPLSPGDIALGELGWALIRGGLYAIGFLVVMVVLGLVVSPWVILAGARRRCSSGSPSAAVGMAATSFMRTWQDFDLIQLVVLPMFLFSATFYPIDDVPAGAAGLVQLTPLYQGVDLIRSLTVGVICRILLVHVAYLSVMGLARAGGHVAAARQAAAQVRQPRRVADRVRWRCYRARSSRAGAARGWSSGASGSPARRSRRFRDETYWGRPRAGLRRPRRADPAARAGAGGARRQPDGPGLHRRRDRATSCGPALHRAGLADRPSSRRADDGLTLTDAYIAAAVRCAPPANKPTTEERDTCAPFLVRELALLDRGAGRRRARRVRLGRGAPGVRGAGACGARRSRGSGTARRPRSGRTRCSASYHPSQQNTFTGRLTPAMFDAVLAARDRPGSDRPDGRRLGERYPASGSSAARPAADDGVEPLEDDARRAPPPRR